MHGGLRYLAKGQLDVAHESAVERGILMQTTAPHLIRALPMLMPLTPDVGRAQAALARSGIRAGDLLRLAARTRRETLPRPAADRRDRDADPRSRRTPEGAAWRDPVVGRPARGRRPPGPRRRPHRGRPRRPGAHPGPGQRGRRRRRAAHRRAEWPEPHDPRTHGHQRHRGLGRRAGPRDPAAAQPRHPPRAAQGHAAGRPLRRRWHPCPVPATGSSSRCPSPTRPSTSASPTRRSTGRSPTCPSRRRRTSTSSCG